MFPKLIQVFVNNLNRCEKEIFLLERGLLQKFHYVSYWCVLPCISTGKYGYVNLLLKRKPNGRGKSTSWRVWDSLSSRLCCVVTNRFVAAQSLHSSINEKLYAATSDIQRCVTRNANHEAKRNANPDFEWCHCVLSKASVLPSVRCKILHSQSLLPICLFVIFD